MNNGGSDIEGYAPTVFAPITRFYTIILYPFGGVSLSRTTIFSNTGVSGFSTLYFYCAVHLTMVREWYSMRVGLVLLGICMVCIRP